MKAPFYIIAFISLIVFSSCKNEVKEVSPSEKAAENTEAAIKIDPSYAQIGLDMAFSTKKQLGKNLMGTMKKKGTKEALQFCNLKAMPLTDSMGLVHQARIKRVSDKTRNPNNKANKTELKSMETFKNMLSKRKRNNTNFRNKKRQCLFLLPNCH